MSAADTTYLVEAMERAATKLEEAAAELRYIATMCGEKGDVSRAVDAISLIAHIPVKCRIDTFAGRAIQAVTHDRG